MISARFLGYDCSQTGLIAEFERRGISVTTTSEPISHLGDVDINICFGYRHLLPVGVLTSSRRPVLNLHISYLPYNRGAHPNFWAHYENTPSGVTIHEIDHGIDAGPICFQRYVNFSPDEDTFAKTHARLLREVENLFIDNFDALLAGTYETRAQRGRGSQHTSAQLPAAISDWNIRIEDALRILDAKSRLERDLEIINEIQSVRTRNNVNWMDLLRIAIEASPSETKKVLRRINNDDDKISELFKKLGEQ